MAGEGGVLFRDKIRTHWLLFLIFLLPLVIEWVVFLTVKGKHGEPLPLVVPAILTVFMTMLAILFSVLRVTVSRDVVQVQYGLFGPKIAVDRIESCNAEHYDWKEFGGFGIRRSRDGTWAYNMMGDQGRAVRIAYRDDKGALRKVLVASKNAEQLAAAINQARAAHGVKARLAESNAAEIAAAMDEIAAELGDDRRQSRR
jgi:hypothetical protein